MRRILITLTFAAALAGCSTTLVPISETKAVPKDEIFAADFTTPKEGAQRVTVARNAGAWQAAGIRLDLVVDGQRTAALATSEAINLYLAPGEHLLKVETSSTTVTIPTRYPVYRIDISDSDGLRLQPSFE
jgi:hypothetical protein